MERFEITKTPINTENIIKKWRNGKREPLQHLLVRFGNGQTEKNGSA